MKHYIIVKFNDTFNYQEHVDEIKDLFNETLKIDGIKEVKLYLSNSKLDNRYDLMIKMILKIEALNEFDNSWIHQKWKDDYDKYIKSKVIFDCD